MTESDCIDMNYLILYNPLSGNGGAEARAKQLKSEYSALGEVSVADITKIDDITPLLQDLGAEDCVIICGGDGTLNRFIYDTEGARLKCDILYSAVGTGNDFLRDLGKSAEDAPFSIKQYLERLPAVEVGGKKCRFLNGIGFGIDGYCCEIGDAQKEKNPEKPVNYTGIAIKGLLGGFKPKYATVTVDGVEHKYPRVWIAATMHGRYYGGGMMCAPDQDRLNEDGTNTLVVWYGSGKLKTLTKFSSIFKVEHVKYTDMIAVHKGHEITVKFNKPCALQIDGETVLGVTEYKVTAPVGAKV